MEAETAESKNPEKEDMDALEVQADPGEGDEEGSSSKEKGASERALERSVGRPPLSDSEVQALLGDLYSKAIFKREDGVCIIWNAFGTLSLSLGLHMKIEGRDYKTQGVIHDKHLVMGCSTKED